MGLQSGRHRYSCSIAVLVIFCVAILQQATAEAQCAWDTHMSKSQESGVNTRRVIDISVTLQTSLPVWDKPDGLGAHRELVERQDQGGVAFVSKLTMVVHTGTHFDAPSHFLQEAFNSGRGIEAIQLSIMNGACNGVFTCYACHNTCDACQVNFHAAPCRSCCCRGHTSQH